MKRKYSQIIHHKCKNPVPFVHHAANCHACIYAAPKRMDSFCCTYHMIFFSLFIAPEGPTWAYVLFGWVMGGRLHEWSIAK